MGGSLVVPGITVLQSRLWATNTGIVHGSEGSLLIDPGISPREMEAVATGAGSVRAGFCTHAHWDHILWHPAFGVETPRYASVETVELMQERREDLLRNLADAEEEAGRGVLWDRSLMFREQPLPWGPSVIAGIQVELIPIRGHEDGQSALVLPELDVCFVADTLSDVETPSLNGGMRRLREYQRSLDRLQQVIDRVAHIVPGHGSVADRPEAQRRLDMDRRYLEALAEATDAGSVHPDTEEVAQCVLERLDERRATPGLAWDMHLENVQALLTERKVGESEPPQRRSSRLILLNDRGEVWMLRINDPLRPRWVLPGGGLELGETWEQAASRELWEECGIRAEVNGPHVAERHAVTAHPGGSTMSHEQYYVVRVGEQQPTVRNMFDYESDDYTVQKWWNTAELRNSYEITYPIGLADLLDAINADRLPPEPIVFLD